MLLNEVGHSVTNEIPGCKCEGVGFQWPVRSDTQLDSGDEIRLNQRKPLHEGLSKRCWRPSSAALLQLGLCRQCSRYDVQSHLLAGMGPANLSSSITLKHMPKPPTPNRTRKRPLLFRCPARWTYR